MTGICGGGRRAGVRATCIATRRTWNSFASLIALAKFLGPAVHQADFPARHMSGPGGPGGIRGLAASSNSGNGRLTILSEFTFPLMLRSFIVRVSWDLTT